MVSSSSHRGCAAAPQPGYDREGWPLLIAAVLPLLAANAGCAEEGSVGAYRLELYDRPVQCAAEQNECTDAAGEAVPPERLRGTANVGRLASRFSPDGIYVYLEFRRANGVIGLLELDIPAPQASRSARAQPRLHLLELQGEQVVFRSARALGRVELPLEPECLCQDGRLELLFTDPGPDGVQGSPDDRVRRLSRAQFSRTGSFCRSPALLDVDDRLRLSALVCPSWAWQGDGEVVAEEEDTLDVVIGCDPEPVEIQEVAEWEEVEGGGWEDEGGEEGEGELEGDELDSPDEEGGCGGNDSVDDGEINQDSDESSGCVEDGSSIEESTDEPSDYEVGGDCSSSGDDSSSSSGDGSGGCEGSSSDSGSSSSSSGGSDCSGSDSGSSAGSACEADAVAATLSPAGRRPLAAAPSAGHPARRHQRSHGIDPSLRLILAGIVVALVRRRVRGG